MKRLTNLIEPTNVIIVSDAYINGDRIVCRSGRDDFDLWTRSWMIEDISGVAVLPGIIEPVGDFHDVVLHSHDMQKATERLGDGTCWIYVVKD